MISGLYISLIFLSFGRFAAHGDVFTALEARDFVGVARDVQVDVDLDFRMQRDRHDMAANRLDRRMQRDLAAADGEARGAQQRGDGLLNLGAAGRILLQVQRGAELLLRRAMAERVRSTLK